MPGGDLMDVLVAEAKVIRQRVPSAAWQVACLAPKVRLNSKALCSFGLTYHQCSRARAVLSALAILHARAKEKGDGLQALRAVWRLVQVLECVRHATYHSACTCTCT
eukprot:GHRQ01022876.1.p1 GENE.GHRQ01022876.1~~GHRQ01022876.1.p1  ORF type:complete len:107 (-),score=16.88 GHRQ01022876.1:567-887(-)